MQQLSVWAHQNSSMGTKATQFICFSDRQGGVGWIPIISTSERQCLSLSQPKHRCTQEPHIKTHDFKAFGLTLRFLLEQILISTRHTYRQTLLPLLPQTILLYTLQLEIWLIRKPTSTVLSPLKTSRFSNERLCQRSDQGAFWMTKNFSGEVLTWALAGIEIIGFQIDLCGHKTL